MFPLLQKFPSCPFAVNILSHPLSSLPGYHWSGIYSSRLVLPDLELINGILQYGVFCSTVFLRFLLVVHVLVVFTTLLLSHVLLYAQITVPFFIFIYFYFYLFIFFTLKSYSCFIFLFFFNLILFLFFYFFL